jgi:hypothetical protein
MRMVYDMNQAAFPYKLNENQVGPHAIKPEHIHSIVELAQVGLQEQDSLWIHTDPISRRDTDTNTGVKGFSLLHQLVFLNILGK